MDLDAKLCYCFRVSRRKIVNFARRERPKRASQLSECWGAGTGCGWCIPFLEQIHKDIVGPDAEHNARLLLEDKSPIDSPSEDVPGVVVSGVSEADSAPAASSPDLQMTSEEYARRRQEYRGAVSRGERSRNAFGGTPDATAPSDGDPDGEDPNDDNWDPF